MSSKKILSLAIATILSIGFVSCGTDSNNDSSTTSPTRTVVDQVTFQGEPIQYVGSLYGYKVGAGCDVDGWGIPTSNTIYSDGTAEKYQQGAIRHCPVENIYDIVPLTNQEDLNATQIDSNAFYDNKSKIYYYTKIVYSNYDGQNPKTLTAIINDGATGILDDDTFVIMKHAFKEADSQ